MVTANVYDWEVGAKADASQEPMFSACLLCMELYEFLMSPIRDRSVQRF